MKTNLKHKLIIIVVLTLFYTITSAQAPEYVLPGQSKVLEPKNDTLWILNNQQFKKTIIAKEQLKICNKQVDEYKKLLDSVQQLANLQKQKSEILEKDRNFYINQNNQYKEDIDLLVKLNKKQSFYTQMAIIVGASTTIIAFILGFIIAK